MYKKRTKQIAVRITDELDRELEIVALSHRWTKSALANIILEAWYEEKKAEKNKKLPSRELKSTTLEQ